MRLKPEHGALEIKAHGIRLTQMSSEKEIKAALAVAPHLSKFIEGIEAETPAPKTEKKDVKASK